MARDKLLQKSYLCLRMCFLAAGGFLLAAFLFGGSHGGKKNDVPPLPGSLHRAMPAPDEIVEALSQSLDDKNWQVRFHAAKALGEIGTQAKSSVPFLLEKVRDRSSMVRYAAVCALGSIDPRQEAVLTVLLKAVEDPESDVRAAAADSLGYLDCPPAVSALVRASQDRDALVRCMAIKSLGKQRTSPAEAVSVLVSALEDKNDEVQAAAALALGEIRAHGEAEIAALIQALGEFGEVRYTAIETLGRLGAGAEIAVPYLINELRYDDVKDTTALALTEIGKKSPQTVSILVETFSGGDTEIRYEIAKILGQIQAEATVPVLIAALSEETLSDCVADALLAIGERAVPALAEHVDHSSGPTKLKAMLILGEIGEQAAVPVLVRQLGDPVADVRSGAAMALGKIATHRSRRL